MCLLDDFGRFFVFMRRFMSEIGVRNPSYKKLKPFIRLVGNSKPLRAVPKTLHTLPTQLEMI